MKYVYTLCFCLAIIFSSFAQQEVQLNINHKFGTQDFGFNMDSENNLSNPFTVTRLEYYISEITVNHDGTSTLIEDLWLLVRGNKSVNVSLGMLDVSEIESVTFHVGVNQSVNHQNPALWHASHPLAPQNPSMHWGWTSGYRFVALEGLSNGTTWQLHGLGDSNYFTTTVNVVPREDAGVLNLDLDANYNAALKDINLASGPISHGETGEARKCLVNFNEDVFTQAGTLSNVKDQNPIEFRIYPNPSSNGIVNIELPIDMHSGYVKIIRADGLLISSTPLAGRSTTIQIAQQGLYLAQIISENTAFVSKMILIQ